MPRYMEISRQTWEDPKFQELWLAKYDAPVACPKSHGWPRYSYGDPREHIAVSARHRYRKILKRIRPIVLARHGSNCLSCGSTDRVRLDHVIPIAWGGTNDTENFQPLCHTCNTKKGSRLPSPPKGGSNGTN